MACIECSTNILIQWLTKSTRLLGTVENCNLFYSRWNSLQEMVYGEWTEEMNCNRTNLLTLSVEEINTLLKCLVNGTNSDYYALSILGTIVIKNMMLTAGNLGHLAHSFFHELWQSIVGLVYSLTTLEINIIILSSTTNYRMVRIQSVATESIYCIPIKNLGQIIIINHFNLLNLVGSAETIKEVQERNLALDSN